MSNTKQKDTVRKIINVFNTGNLTEVNLLFSPEYIDHQRPPWMDAIGQEEFKQIVALARKSLPNLHVTIKDLIAEENTVVARLHWNSVDTKGKKIDRETIDILRFADGKAVEHWGAEAWSSENPNS
jgi:predicted SnoaL-like aldol condensation-catalyzing enzyme